MSVILNFYHSFLNRNDFFSKVIEMNNSFLNQLEHDEY